MVEVFGVVYVLWCCVVWEDDVGVFEYFEFVVVEGGFFDDDGVFDLGVDLLVVGVGEDVGFICCVV